MAVSAKARVAQLTGLPSITAAAEGPVTFGCFFYRWKARLLSGWGSSLAQGTGGRVRAPAPTAYPKVRLIFCRARCPIGPFSGGPVCRPYEIWETFRSFRRGRSQTGPRAAKGRPYGGKRAGSVGSSKPGAVFEPQQFYILHTQGPVARRKFRPATQILRAGTFLPGSRGDPRNGGSRGRATWRREALPNRRLRPPPSAFLVTFWASKKSLAARRRRNSPCKKRNRSVIAPSSVWPSASHLPPRGKA